MVGEGAIFHSTDFNPAISSPQFFLNDSQTSSWDDDGPMSTKTSQWYVQLMIWDLLPGPCIYFCGENDLFCQCPDATAGSGSTGPQVGSHFAYHTDPQRKTRMTRWHKNVYKKSSCSSCGSFIEIFELESRIRTNRNRTNWYNKFILSLRPLLIILQFAMMLQSENLDSKRGEWTLLEFSKEYLSLCFWTLCFRCIPPLNWTLFTVGV